jgi:hypothetical protein
VLGSRVFSKSDFVNEGELENFVSSNSEIIFPDDVIFLPQKHIHTSGGAGTIPDAIVIDPGSEKWFIVEVELARHSVWGHMVEQVSKQIVSAKNPRTRKEFVEKVISSILEAPDKKGIKKFTDRGIPEIHIQQKIEKITDKVPDVIIPIDEIPPDLDELAKIFNTEVKLVQVEKYVDPKSGDRIYNVRSDRLISSPSPEAFDHIEKSSTASEKPPLTEQEFLKQCDSPGKILFEKLKQLASEKGDEFKIKKQAMPYYAISKKGRFSPLSLWPKFLTIHKNYVSQRKEIKLEALAKFRTNVISISDLASKYDTMRMPGLSTREGDLTKGEIDSFMVALKQLLDSIER